MSILATCSATSFSIPKGAVSFHLLYPDSAVVSDTAEFSQESEQPNVESIHSYGSIVHSASDTALTVNKSQRRSIQYHTFGELLMRGTLYQPLSQGGFGQYDAISIAGSLQPDVAVSWNGRTLQSAWNNQLHLSILAPEAVERVEVLTGLNAIGLAPQLTQTALNLQEVRYSTERPHTALWYSQGGGEVVAADAVFAQNVARGLNLNLGVRRSGADGRYNRTRFDVWNIRAGIRYAPDSLSTMGFNYQLSSHNTDLWGGLRTDGVNVPTEGAALTVFNQLRDHERRHDVTLGYNRFLSNDSLHELAVTAYYTFDGLLRNRDTSLVSYSTDTSRNVQYLSHQSGIAVRTRHKVHNTLLRFGFLTDYVNNHTAAYTSAVNTFQPRALFHMVQTLNADFKVLLASHLAYEHNRVVWGAGAGVAAHLHSVHTRLDVSVAQRSPSAAEGLTLAPEQTFLGLLEATVNLQSLLIRGNVFYRSTSNYLAAIATRDADQLIQTVSVTNAGSRNVAGITAEANYMHQWFEIRPIVRVHYQTGEGVFLPPFSAECSINGVYNIGRNSVRLGARLSGMAPMTGGQYVPLHWLNVTPVSDQQSWVSNGLDLFFTAHLGNASIRASYENVLAQRWYTVAVAPQIIRDFRLSVHWSFFD